MAKRVEGGEMKKKYWVELYYDYIHEYWQWRIVCINGKGGAASFADYKNKAQCRNAAKNFAKYAGLEVRE